jgi:predicted lipoprotein with Yx(FWY)xxD motif
MKRIATFLTLGLLVLAGCGDDGGDSDGSSAPPPAERTATAPASPTEAAKPEPARTGTKIVLGDSQFGSMLYDSRKQAIYIFEKDPKNKTVCYGDCATAWPPVYTKGEPQAAKGVKQSLLGTVKRRDGRSQVTYAGQPLYFYVNEGPGEVRCHNVFLNGGTWWVIGPDGKRRA